jgi:hypothetical protein
LPITLAISALLTVGLGLALRAGRRRGLDRWLPNYICTVFRRGPVSPNRPVHLILCIADHFEPCHRAESTEVADARVARWLTEYPRLFGRFEDSDGCPPKHTFFYPIEQYDEAHVNSLAELCRSGFGEVEIHLHHDGDTAALLRDKLIEATTILANRHELLARHRKTGDAMYGFVHGDWALDNSLPNGRCCGVTNELAVLRETGCYADFTLPAAPALPQTSKINSIYYAVGAPGKSKSHDTGSDVGAGPAPTEGLMIVQGPLLLDWGNRKWGALPRIENACIQSSQPATVRRLAMWLRAHVQVRNRPDWFFVKLHTHGAPEWNQKVVLGEPMVNFHEELARLACENPQFQFHYVTARELYNLVRAAESGWCGSVAAARDFELVWNGTPTAKSRQMEIELPVPNSVPSACVTIESRLASD